jgi:hypothetical protein
MSQSEQARASLADAQAPVAGWDAAAFEAPCADPWIGLEGKLQVAVEAYLKLKGAWFVHERRSKGEAEGTPDLLIWYQGVSAAIELKNKYGTPSAAQRDALVKIRRNGGQAWIARSLPAVMWVLEHAAVIDRRETQP